jgi:hypothetical protein
MIPDISTFSFEEWVRFIFDHPVGERPWDRNDFSYDISDEEKIVSYLIQLFKNPLVLLEKFSEEQINQGFWFMLGTEGFMGVLWNTNIPFSNRNQCFDAMYDLYQLLFLDHPLDSIDFMWWDMLSDMYDLYDGKPRDDDDAMVQEAMLHVLIRLLDTKNSAQAKAALHGLSHLKHPKGKEAIDHYLLRNPDIDEELRKYALQCKEYKKAL